MVQHGKIIRLVSLIRSYDGVTDKTALCRIVQSEFGLIRDRSVYYCESFAIRFCSSKTNSFSNTVLSLSCLQKYDGIPFIVCLVTPSENKLMLANSTFLRKISHSSEELRTNNIRGSFNGSDIIKSFEGVDNTPENFGFLFSSHENYTFEENLVRLVEATNNIRPVGKKFTATDSQRSCILGSVDRAVSFANSEEYTVLEQDLRKRVEDASSEIVIASHIENVNLRGRIIEYLITSSENLHRDLVRALRMGEPLPDIYTADKLGDYERGFERFITETDIKTKILYLSSNPKGYNIDKLLSFLAEENSVYLVFVVAIDENDRIMTRLCSMYHRQLLEGTRIMRQWAGRHSRGVTQYDGDALKKIVFDFERFIDREASLRFIERCLNE